MKPGDHITIEASDTRAQAVVVALRKAAIVIYETEPAGSGDRGTMLITQDSEGNWWAYEPRPRPVVIQASHQGVNKPCHSVSSTASTPR
jgi:hypothetical protein